ncbi:unnamed protein product, partial [Closterium sp. NIES-65]
SSPSILSLTHFPFPPLSLFPSLLPSLSPSFPPSFPTLTQSAPHSLSSSPSILCLTHFPFPPLSLFPSLLTSLSPSFPPSFPPSLPLSLPPSLPLSLLSSEQSWQWHWAVHGFEASYISRVGIGNPWHCNLPDLIAPLLPFFLPTGCARTNLAAPLSTSGRHRVLSHSPHSQAPGALPRSEP